MICPQLKVDKVVLGYTRDGKSTLEYNGIPCAESECAWWSKEQGVCSVVAISNSLSYVAVHKPWGK